MNVTKDGLKNRQLHIEDYLREFDSCITEKVLAGIDLPAFFVSTISFCSIVFYCNV